MNFNIRQMLDVDYITIFLDSGCTYRFENITAIGHNSFEYKSMSSGDVCVFNLFDFGTHIVGIAEHHAIGHENKRIGGTN